MNMKVMRKILQKHLEKWKYDLIIIAILIFFITSMLNSDIENRT